MCFSFLALFYAIWFVLNLFPFLNERSSSPLVSKALDVGDGLPSRENLDPSGLDQQLFYRWPYFCPASFDRYDCPEDDSVGFSSTGHVPASPSS